MKGLVHHTPTDDDVSNLLKEFTVDFLLKAYSCLVQDLHTGLVCDNEMVILKKKEENLLRNNHLRFINEIIFNLAFSFRYIPFLLVDWIFFKISCTA